MIQGEITGVNRGAGVKESGGMSSIPSMELNNRVRLIDFHLFAENFSSFAYCADKGRYLQKDVRERVDARCHDQDERKSLLVHRGDWK